MQYMESNLKMKYDRNEVSVYWFPNNFKSIDELWETEKEGN